MLFAAIALAPGQLPALLAPALAAVAGLAAVASVAVFLQRRSATRAARWSEPAVPRSASALRFGAGNGTLSDAHMALLTRVADGQSTFLPDDQVTADAGQRFDAFVEELLRLQHRGLFTGATAWAEVHLPGREYAAVTNVELTPAGLAAIGRPVEGSRPSPPPGGDGAGAHSGEARR
jgi:hypothetical protein